MTEETLRQLLARVPRASELLERSRSEARDMLATVMRDIDARSRRRGQDDTVSTVSVSPEARVAATARASKLFAVRFEAQHPIAQLLRQIGALLGQAGI